MQPVNSSTKGNQQQRPQIRPSQRKEEVQPQPQPQNQVSTQQPQVNSKLTFAEILKRGKYQRRPRQPQENKYNQTTTYQPIHKLHQRKAHPIKPTTTKNGQVLHSQEESGGLYVLLNQTAEAIKMLNENFTTLLSTRMTHSEEW